MSQLAHVAAITPADRAEVAALLRSAPWQYEHWDLPRGGILEQAGYLARDGGGRLLGVLGCWLDRPPVASILYAVLGSGVAAPAQTIGALLPPAESELRAAGATELTFVGAAAWLVTCLEKNGFARRTTVITYRRWGGGLSETGNRHVVVRPALPDEAEVIADLDRAAFEPMWCYPAEAHRVLIGRLPHYIIAEAAGRPVGYAASDIVWGHGHLVRLAVHPDWRRRGVGTRLMAEALAFFERRGIVLVMLNTQADNAPSRRLYERLGFTLTGEEAPALVKPL